VCNLGRSRTAFKSFLLAPHRRVDGNGCSPRILDLRSRVPCEEKNRLAMEYDAATSEFSEAVRELHRRIGTSPKEEHDRLERASTEARVKC
jgi:hypothetical protein